MKAVLTYETSDVSMEEIMKIYPQHKEYLENFKTNHVVYGIAPFKDRKGSMEIFADAQSAEEFATNDPFVINGIAKNIVTAQPS